MTKTHNWITYVNPRNGKVRVKACSLCGIMNMPLTANSECNLNTRTDRMANWTPLNKPSQKNAA